MNFFHLLKACDNYKIITRKLAVTLKNAEWGYLSFTKLPRTVLLYNGHELCSSWGRNWAL